MDKKKGYLSLLGIVAVLIAGIYMCIFGVDEMQRDLRKLLNKDWILLVE